MCVMKKKYMNIITGQTNSFSRWVCSTIAVQSSDPSFRPATSDPFNKGTLNVQSYIEMLLCEVKFVFW